MFGLTLLNTVFRTGVGYFSRITIISLVGNQTAGRPFSITIYLSDNYGNLLLDSGRNISSSLVILDQAATAKYWLLSTNLSALGTVSFSRLLFNNAMVTCFPTFCLIPKFALVFSGLSCSDQTNCTIQSKSNPFSLDSDSASNLVLLSNKAKLGNNGSFQELALQIQDKYGNIVLNQRSCPSICVAAAAPLKLSILNSNNSCLEPKIGRVYFYLALDRESTNATLRFSCTSRNYSNGTLATLEVINFQFSLLKSMAVLSQPQSLQSAGRILIPQPTIQLCSSCADNSACCVFNVSGVALIDKSNDGANGLSGNLSTPIIDGLGVFTDLKVNFGKSSMNGWFC